MKTTILKTFVLLFLTSTFITACSSDNDGDTTAPTINLIAPAEGATLKIGDAHGVHFDMEVSDNEGLASYKVEIHNNFDGHTHTRAEDATTPFAFNRSWDLEGVKNKKIHHHEIIIPENATPGNYHLMVFCSDTSGNEAYVARNIILSNEVEDDNHEHSHE